MEEEFMVFRQIHITNNRAPKLRGDGLLTYQLWVDDGVGLYVQIEENEAAGKVPASLLFPVAKYAAQRNSEQSLGELTGYELVGGAERTSKNGDVSGFLKAVLCHLLDRGASA
jgi:hypothetical protein